MTTIYALPCHFNGKKNTSVSYSEVDVAEFAWTWRGRVSILSRFWLSLTAMHNISSENLLGYNFVFGDSHRFKTPNNHHNMGRAEVSGAFSCLFKGEGENNEIQCAIM